MAEDMNRRGIAGFVATGKDARAIQSVQGQQARSRHVDGSEFGRRAHVDQIRGR